MIRSALFFAVVVATLSTASAADVTTLAGRKVTGTLVAIDATTIAVQEPGAATPTRLATKELATVETRKLPAPPKDAKFDELELTDGTVLRLTKLLVRGKQIEPALLTPAEPLTAPKVELPLGTAFSYLRNADDAKSRDEWKKLLAGRGKRDLFVVRGADGLNPLAGTVIEGTDGGDVLTFEREDGQRVNLKLSRASGGIAFNQPPRDQVPPTLCKVGDAFGNTLVATRLDLAGSTLKVTTVAGATVTYAELDAVVVLDFRQGNLTYLSDLDATADYAPVEKDGLLGEQFGYQRKLARDRSLDGSDLTLDGKKFARGVSLPPDSTAAYKLDGGYREFKAVVGIQDGANRESWSLRLRVEVGGRAVFDEVVKKAMKPREIVLNVKDAKELRVTVERVGLFAGDQINLGDARLQK